MMKPKALTPHEEGLLEYLEDIIGSDRFLEAAEEAAKSVEALSEKRVEKVCVRLLQLHAIIGVRVNNLDHIRSIHNVHPNQILLLYTRYLEYVKTEHRPSKPQTLYRASTSAIFLF